MLKIRLFGRFAVYKGGKRIDLTSSTRHKTHRLLQVLASEPGRIFTVEEIIEALWPQADPGRARSNVKARISELRRLLEPDLPRGNHSRYIQYTYGGYRLNLHEVTLDTLRFEHHHRRGRDLEAQGSWEEAAQEYERALAEWRGEFLEDERYAEWTFPLRQHWNQRYVALLKNLAGCYRQLGHFPKAIELFRQALKASPYDEELYRQLIQAYVEEGNHAAAWAVYKECRTRLEEDLGIAPSPETERLYARLCSSDPKPAQPDLHQPPFVGRQEQMTQLSQYLERAQAGNPHLVLIEGEAGIGKTRLLREFVAQMKGRNARYIHVFLASAEDPRAPFSLLGSALRDGLQRQPWLAQRVMNALDPAWKEELSEWVPLPPPENREETATKRREKGRLRLPDQAHRIRQEALIQAFFALSRSGTLLLACDDLPRADSASLEGLRHLLKRSCAHALPVLIVGTYRTEKAQEEREQAAFRMFLGDLESQGIVERIPLLPLSEASVVQLFSRLGGETLPDELIERFYQASEGNPLLLLALLEAALQEGQLRFAGGRWEVVGEIEELPLPSEWISLIVRRLEGLGEDERTLLEAAAVWARPFDFGWIREVLGWPRIRTAKALEGAQQAALLVKGNGTYRFAHEIYREQIYEQIDPMRRRDLHWRIAEKLRRDPQEPKPLQAIAEHYEAAGDLERALSYGLDALKEAGDAWQTAEALALVEWALGLIDRLEQEAEKRVVTLSRRDLLEARMKAITVRERMNDGLGRREAQEEDLQQLRALACALRSRTYLTEVYNRRAVLCWRMGKLEEGAHYGERALRWARRAKDRRREGTALHNLGLIRQSQGHLSEALEQVQKAYRIDQEIGDERLQATALNTIAGIYNTLGNTEQALKHLEKACTLYRRVEDVRYEANALHNLGTIHEELGDQEQAESHYRRALQRFRLVGDRLGEAATLIRLADLDRERGDLKAAMEQLEIAYAIHREISDPEGEFEALLAMAEVYKARQEWEEGLARLREALGLVKEHGFSWHEAIARLEMAVLLIEKGDPKAALPWAEEGVARMEEMELRDYLPKGYFQLYRALRALGRREEALEHLEKAYREVQRQAEGLPSEELKRRFLESTGREILEAWERRQ